MRITRAYEFALRLYPTDYRARFAREMLAAFEEAVTDHRHESTVTFVRFALAELAALVSGIGAEWSAKLTADRTTRGRCLPDCRMMRPAGVTREEWAAGLEGTVIRHGDTHAGPAAG